MVSIKKLVISLCIIGLIVLGAIALVNIFKSNEKSIVQSTPLKIGFVTPLSGPGASIGQEELDVAQMAVDEINSQGGVLGKKLELIPEDGKCDGKEASTIANKLVNIDKVKIILGGACSSETLAMAPITEENKVILFSGISSNPQISDMGEYIFRTSSTDEDFFRPEARYFYEKLDYKKVGVLSENTDYSLSAKDAFVDEFKKLGGEVVSVEIAKPEERDYKTHITKILSRNPDAFVIIPQTPATGGLMAKQVRQQSNIQILGSYSMETEEAITSSEGSLNGAYIFTVASPSAIPEGKEVIARYQAKFNKEPPEPYAALAAWDRVFIIKQAIEACKELNTDCIKDYLYTAKFSYSIGDYTFDKKGDITVFYTGVYKISNNKKEIVEPGIKVVKS